MTQRSLEATLTNWNPKLLDEGVAPGFTAFTAAHGLDDLRPAFPLVEHWFADYFLNTVFRARFKPGLHQLALGVIRRTQNAFWRYHEALDHTHEFLATKTYNNPQPRLYFKIVDKWEAFALQYEMAIDLLKAVGSGAPVFTKNDGSVEQRIYTIANQVKHHASCIKSGQAPSEHTVPLWLSNDGIHSFDYNVGYAEAAGALRDAAVVAEMLKDPKSIGEREARVADDGGAA